MKNPNLNPSPNPNPDHSSDPFFDIMLCVKTTKFKNCFECQRFDSFLKADEYFKNKYTNKSELICSSMIPISKLYPRFMESYVLEYKLSKQFNKINILDNPTKPNNPIKPTDSSD
jgi:hypothetical protein